MAIVSIVLKERKEGGSIVKYIRTKDGRIFQNYDNLQIIDNTLCNMQNGKVWLMLGEILKQANTIEELCDVFVYKNKIVEPPIINKEKPKYSYILVEIDDNTPFYTRRLTYLNDLEETLYGAIWTEWGLKYVAKMNDKGELELL